MHLSQTINVLKAPGKRKIILKQTNLRGGEGILYQINGINTKFIAKIFFKSSIAQKKFKKITALIELFQTLSKNKYWEEQFNNSLAMPRARLYDPSNEEFVGFLMNYFDQSIRLDYFIEDKYREINREKDKLVKFHVSANIVRLVKN